MTFGVHILFPKQTTIQAFRSASIAIFVVIALAVVQDFFQSWRNNYSFYLSESLLFKVYWVWFAPLVFAGIKIQERLSWFSEQAPDKKSSASVPNLLFIRRLVMQTLVTRILALTVISALIHALLFSVSVYALSALFFDHTYSFAGNLTYTFSNDSIVYLLVYGGVWFVLLYRQRASERLQENSSEKRIEHDVLRLSLSSQYPQITLPQHIWVGTGKQRISVPLEDILCITASAPYITLHTQNKEYLHNQTLKTLHHILPAEQFVRIHKSTIINLKSVVAYTSRLNGDYDVSLTNGQEVRLSRNYAKDFKERLEKIIPTPQKHSLDAMSSS